MPNNEPNSTDYEHPNEPNLVNLHKAMEYTNDGKPAVRVLSNIQGDITIEGDVTIPGEVTVVQNDADNLNVHARLFDETDTEYSGSNPLTIDGTVTVNQPVAVTDNGGSLTVDGTVAFSNTTIEVTQGTDPWTVDGTVELGSTSLSALENINATVSGTVTVDSITGNVTITDGGGSITVDGTVSVDNFPATQTVDGDVGVTGDVNVTQGTTPWTVQVSGGSGSFPSEVISTDPYGESVIRIDDTTKQHTSTNRVKTSDQQIMFFNTFQYTKDPQIWDESITGTATSEFSEFDGCVIMSVNGEAGDEVVRQTRTVMPYIPGRQNELVMAVKYETPVPGIRRRAGIFNGNNGMFFEDNGGEYSVVIRRNTASGVVENQVLRDDWNIDKMDGTGPSGITADPEKIQMLVIEYEWYGAGIVEFKYVMNNNSYPIHRFDHANISDTIYTNTPFLPVRFELTDVTGTAGSYELHQGSTALRMEGGVGPLGREENVATPFTGVSTGSANVLRPVLSIRLRSDRLQGVAIPIQFQAAALDNTALFYQVIRDTTLTGADWNNVPGNSFCEYDYAATSYTGGEALQTGYISPTNQGEVFNFPKETILQLARNDLGTTSETFTILCATVQSNKDVFASISWVEIR